MRRADSRFRSDIPDWIDGRLGKARRARLERHLEACPDCRNEYKALASVKAALGGTPTSRELPRDLAERLRVELDREDAAASRGPSVAGHGPAWRLAAVLFGATILAAVLFFSRSQRPELAALALRDSERITSGRLGLELDSDSPQVISRFFSERHVGFPVPPESLEIPKWRLAGARVHNLGGRPSALYLYRDAGGRMIVCQMYKGRVAELPRSARILRSDGATLYVLRSSGRTAVFWQEGPTVCALVSDIPREEILRIARAKVVKAQA